MIQLKASVPASLPAAAGSNEYDLQSCALKSRRVSKLPAAALLAEFASTLARDRGTTVDLLIQMGEIEARKLYLGRSCASMYAYCTERLNMCEGTACRRIAAARAARRFPFILPMLADGTIHLSAVSALAPHLTRENARALLAKATHKSKAEVELLLARHFPKPDVATAVRPLADAISAASMAAQVVANLAQSPPPVAVVPMIFAESSGAMGPLPISEETGALHQVMSQVVAAAAANGITESAPESLLAHIADAVTQTIVKAAASVAPDAAAQGDPRARVTPRSAGRFAWQLTANQHMQDLLEEAQELIGHAGPRDLASVLERALTLLVESLRKSKCAATSRPRVSRGVANGRHVPAAVARAVWERDGHQCTFRGDDGRRCSERSGLQLDHVIPFALGGRTTVENLRLLCRAHNQYEAERIHGETHMREQRAAALARSEKARAARAETAARTGARHDPPSQHSTVRALGLDGRCGPA